LKGIYLYVGGFILPDKNAAAHRVLSNAKILRRLGYQTIFVGVTKTKDRIIAELKPGKTQGFKFYEINYPRNSVQWIHYLSSISILLKVLRRYPNIKGIIAYNYPAVGLAKLLLLSRKTGIPIIADSTEWYGAESGSFFFRVLKKLDNYFRMVHLHRRCAGVICISTYIKNLYPMTTNILLPPLVDLNESKWKLPNSDIGEKKIFSYIGSAGSTIEKESLLELLTVFVNELSPEIAILQVVGVTKDEAIQQGMLDERTNPGSNVDFLGQRSHKECLHIINASHYFIFIRNNSIVTRAGFPTKFVESISAGTPVVTNQSSDLGDYLIEGKNGFWLNPEDLKSFSRSIQDLIEIENSVIKKIKENCQNSKTFSYESYVDEFRQFLKLTQS
jgi:glycosyltransferase involved in cell wall biosynthesis